ncbi:MAG: glycosyltransferase [Thaumarchaeota archaeon]|nr:glycosyltransferase [Candidatus Calditenuaceae archaeon]
MKVLIVTDGANITTGYGNIAYSFAKYLLRIGGFEVVFGSLQQYGGPVYVKVDSEYVPMYSVQGGQHAYFERTLIETRPNLVIHIRDPIALVNRLFPGAYRFKPLAEQYGAKVIHWVPLMGELPSDVLSALTEDSDFILTPTKWAYDLMLYGGVPSNRMAVLRWGADPEVFNENDSIDKGEARQLLGLQAQSYVVTTIGVHDRHHKAFPVLMKALAILLKTYDDIEFYLHSSYGAFDILHYAESLGLKGRIVMPRVYIKDWGWDVNTYRKIFAATDVYVTASMAEGFNIPPVEAAFCGVPVVASDHPVHREVLANVAIFTRTVNWVPDSQYFNYLTDPMDIVAAVIKVRNGWRPSSEVLSMYRERMSWKAIVDDFVSILKEHQEVIKL